MKNVFTQIKDNSGLNNEKFLICKLEIKDNIFNFKFTNGLMENNQNVNLSNQNLQKINDLIFFLENKYIKILENKTQEELEKALILKINKNNEGFDISYDSIKFESIKERLNSQLLSFFYQDILQNDIVFKNNEEYTIEQEFYQKNKNLLSYKEKQEQEYQKYQIEQTEKNKEYLENFNKNIDTTKKLKYDTLSNSMWQEEDIIDTGIGAVIEFEYEKNDLPLYHRKILNKIIEEFNQEINNENFKIELFNLEPENYEKRNYIVVGDNNDIIEEKFNKNDDSYFKFHPSVLINSLLCYKIFIEKLKKLPEFELRVKGEQYINDLKHILDYDGEKKQIKYIFDINKPITEINIIKKANPKLLKLYNDLFNFDLNINKEINQNITKIDKKENFKTIKKLDTEELKNLIINLFKDKDNQLLKNWKRTSKKKLNGNIVRTFKNDITKKEVLIETDNKDLNVLKINNIDYEENFDLK